MTTSQTRGSFEATYAPCAASQKTMAKAEVLKVCECHGVKKLQGDEPGQL
jgi:hypothetical protein